MIIYEQLTIEVATEEDATAGIHSSLGTLDLYERARVRVAQFAIQELGRALQDAGFTPLVTVLDDDGEDLGS